MHNHDDDYGSSTAIVKKGRSNLAGTVKERSYNKRRFAHRRSEEELLLQRYYKENRIKVLHDGSFDRDCQITTALSPADAEAVLRAERPTERSIIDRVVHLAKAHGRPFGRDALASAQRILIEELKKDRLVEIALPLLKHEPVDPIAASLQWEMLAELHETDPNLTIGVFQHFIYQVKRKLLGLPVTRHLVPVIWNAQQGSGKTNFVRAFTAPMKELVTGSALLDDVADKRFAGLFSFYVVFIDDMGRLTPKLVPVFKSVVTDDKTLRRQLGTSQANNFRQLATFIGTSNTPVMHLIDDETGHRRFAMLPFKNGEAKKGGNQRIWDIVNNLDYRLLWQSVDPFALQGPIEGQLSALYRHQGNPSLTEPLAVWLKEIDFEDAAVVSIITRHGIQSKNLLDLFNLQTNSNMNSNEFSTRMKSLCEHPDIPFGPVKIADGHRMFYPIKERQNP